jgi:hypothetical protein
MAYVQVPDPLLNANKPGRSTDWVQFRDNQDDFDGRITALEDPSIRIASHFSTPIGDAQIITTGAASYAHHPDWYVETGAPGIIQNGIWVPNLDNHILHFNPSASGGEHLVCGKTGFYFDNRTKPLVCKIRFKINDTTANGWSQMFIGLGSSSVGGAWPQLNTEPTDGIYLYRFDPDEWDVRARRASVDTDAGNWVHGLDDTWVELIITWIAAASAVSVTVNGTERGAFTVADNIPDDRVVYPFVSAWSNNDGSDYVYIDRIECYASGALTDATI